MTWDDISDARDLSNELLPILSALCRMEVELSSLEQDNGTIDEAVATIKAFVMGCEGHEYSHTVTIHLEGGPSCPRQWIEAQIHLKYRDNEGMLF